MLFNMKWKSGYKNGYSLCSFHYKAGGKKRMFVIVDARGLSAVCDCGIS